MPLTISNQPKIGWWKIKKKLRDHYPELCFIYWENKLVDRASLKNMAAFSATRASRDLHRRPRCQ